ncbi:MAG: glycerophosphodiester phosphodiesterase [Clostridia bacterium]|nr:glycerophosphodiester phosphodiesterase [Clostridia bacterium]
MKRPEKVFIEGHRGFCAKYPENTLASFRAALALPIDAFEFDVWLSRDKVPVIMHDGNARRTCGVDRDLRDMTLAEIRTLDAGSSFDPAFRGEKVPTLREVLELVKSTRPSLRLGVEIKEYTEENVDLTVAMLKEYGFFDGCWFYAFNGRIIRYLKTKYGARTMGYPDFQMREFTPGTYDFYDEIGLSMNLVKSELLPLYQAKGMPIHMYCADTKEDAELCLREGASLITANDPRPLIGLMREKGLL